MDHLFLKGEDAMKNFMIISLFLFVAWFSPADAQVIDQALLARG
jgi:hypothetical protein